MDIWQKLQRFFREDFQSHASLIRNSLLAYFVFSSKHLIIYNEETLVLLSFIGFVFLSSHMMSESIEKSLNERSLAISQELQNSLNSREEFLRELFHEHQKQLSLKSFFHKFHQSISHEILSLHHNREKALHGIFSHEISQKLQGLFGSHQSFQERLQKVYQSAFRASVFETFLKKRKTMKANLLQGALRHLKRHRMA